MRAFATVASKYSRGFGHVTTRQNIQLHFVLLKDCEDAMRIMADEGLTTREACGNAVRNVTGCPYMGTSHSEIFDVVSVRRGADALLPAASARRGAAAQVQDRVRGLHRGSRARVDQRHRLAREDSGRQARLPRDDCRRHVDHAGHRLRALRVPAGGGDAERGRGRAARLPQVRRLRAPAAEPHEVRGEAAWLGRRSAPR